MLIPKSILPKFPHTSSPGPYLHCMDTRWSSSQISVKRYAIGNPFQLRLCSLLLSSPLLCSPLLSFNYSFTAKYLRI